MTRPATGDDFAQSRALDQVKAMSGRKREQYKSHQEHTHSSRPEPSLFHLTAASLLPPAGARVATRLPSNC